MDLLSFALYHEGGETPPSTTHPPTPARAAAEEEEEEEEGGKKRRKTDVEEEEVMGGKKKKVVEEEEEEEVVVGGKMDGRVGFFLQRLNAALQQHGDGLPLGQLVELLNEEGGWEGKEFTLEETMALVVEQDEKGKCYWEEEGQVIYSS